MANKTQLDIFDFQTKMTDRRIKWLENGNEEIEADLRHNAEIIKRVREKHSASVAEYPNALRAIEDAERQIVESEKRHEEGVRALAKLKRSMEELYDQQKFRVELRKALVDNIRQTEEASKPQKMGLLDMLGAIVVYENLKPKR